MAKNAAHSPILWLAIFVVGGLVVLGFAGFGPLSAFSGQTQITPGTGETQMKTITVSGGFIQPDGNIVSTTASTVFGNAIFFDSAGTLVTSGSIAAATGTFSIAMQSGKSYQLYFFPSQGNAVAYAQKVFQVTVPGYSSDSEVTTYAFADSFIVYQRCNTIDITTVFGGNAMTRHVGGAFTGATGGTNDPAQGAGDGLYAGTATWFYHLGVGITHGVPAPMTISLTAITAYRQFGSELSIPNYASHTVKPWVVVTFGANSSASLYQCATPYVAFTMNATVFAWAFEFPVVQSNAAAAVGSVSMSWMFANAVAHTYFNVFLGFNNTLSNIATNHGYASGPIGYGSAWWIHVIGGAPTGVDGSALNVA